MEFPVLLLMMAVNPIQSVIDTAWRSKIDVSEKRSWKGDLMRAPGTRCSILVKQSYIQPLWLCPISCRPFLTSSSSLWFGSGQSADGVDKVMGLTVFKTLEATQALIGELLLMIVKSTRSALDMQCGSYRKCQCRQEQATEAPNDHFLWLAGSTWMDCNIKLLVIGVAAITTLVALTRSNLGKLWPGLLTIGNMIGLLQSRPCRYRC